MDDDFFAVSNCPVQFGALLKQSAQYKELHKQLCAEVNDEDNEEEMIITKRKRPLEDEVAGEKTKFPKTSLGEDHVNISSNSSSRGSSPEVSMNYSQHSFDIETQKLLQEADFALYKINNNTSIESKDDESFTDSYCVEQNNLTLRIRCKSKLYKYTVRKDEPLSNAVEMLASDLDCNSDQIILQQNLQDISIKNTPKTLHLTSADILDAFVIDKSFKTHSSKASSFDSSSNSLILKIQTSKRFITYIVDKTEPLGMTFKKFSNELNIPYSKVQFYFDGERINSEQSPNELDMEIGVSVVSHIAHAIVMASPLDQGALLLKKQLMDLQKTPVEGFSAGLISDDDLYSWEVMIMGPSDTFYEGGFFKAHLIFPKEYPQKPPKMKFISEMWHPNIDVNGDVCISILHDPGEDKWGYERPEERWLPIHTVETIIMSVISMLADPNDESPANVDAGKEWRNDYEGSFRRKVMKCVRKSQDCL